MLRPREMLFAVATATLALVVVHLFGARIRFLSHQPRSRSLSAAGGASVAYVFVQLMPEIAEAQHTLAKTARGSLWDVLDRHAYLLALIGLASFYGLERFTLRSRSKSTSAAPVDDHVGRVIRGGPGSTSGPAFALSIGSFALYNVLLGYILARSERTAVALVLYALAIALHFLVTDFSLREHHKRQYDRIGRWVLTAAVLAGVAFGLLVDVPETFVRAALAFVVGGIVLNVLKEELPAERSSRFWAFVAGAAGYAAVLLVV